MRQSSRIYFVGKDHKDIYFQGHYHDKMYIGSQLVWEKLKGGEYIFDFEFKYYEEEEGYYLTAIGHPLDLKGSSVSIPVKNIKMIDALGYDYSSVGSKSFLVTAGKDEYAFIVKDNKSFTVRRFRGGKVTDTITFTVDEEESVGDLHSYYTADGQYNFYLISKKSGYDYDNDIVFVYTIKNFTYSKKTFTVDDFVKKEIYSLLGDENVYFTGVTIIPVNYNPETESLIVWTYCSGDAYPEGYWINVDFSGMMELKKTGYRIILDWWEAYKITYIDNIKHQIKDTENGKKAYFKAYLGGEKEKLDVLLTVNNSIISQKSTFGGYKVEIGEYPGNLTEILDIKQYNGNYYSLYWRNIHLLNTGASIGLNYTTNIYIDTEDNLRKEAAADENG